MSVAVTILRSLTAVFVIGLALEVAGAALLAAELLTLDPRKRAGSPRANPHRTCANDAQSGVGQRPTLDVRGRLSAPLR